MISDENIVDLAKNSVSMRDITETAVLFMDLQEGLDYLKKENEISEEFKNKINNILDLFECYKDRDKYQSCNLAYTVIKDVPGIKPFIKDVKSYLSFLDMIKTGEYKKFMKYKLFNERLNDLINVCDTVTSNNNLIHSCSKKLENFLLL
jgi:hypothetical protein